MKVLENFLSLQGEGLKIGCLSYFIRASGCNLRCSWCDTAFSHEYGNGAEMSLDEIVKLVGDVENVCFTGGEPLEQPEAVELLERLVKEGKTIVLETNGSKDISVVPDSEKIIISMDIKCPSSGMQDRMLLSNLGHMRMKDQLKFVIADMADLEYAEKILKEYPVHTNVIFSPVGGLSLQFLAETVVAKKLDVRVLPQLHKIIWGNKQGV